MKIYLKTWSLKDKQACQYFHQHPVNSWGIDKFKNDTEFFWKCYEELIVLPDSNRFTLYWVPGLTKGSYWQPKRKELVQQHKNQLIIIRGLKTGHFPFRGYLKKIGLFNKALSCRQCNKGSPHPTLRECEA